MLLVLTSIFDGQSVAAVEHWRAKGATAHVVTCHDLAQPGWQLTVDDQPATLVVDGKIVPAIEIKAIVTRLHYVTASELPFIHEDDREYAASEMHAFLLALLTSIACPVLNKAVPGSLNGPAWSPEEWTRCAAGTGAAVRPITRNAYAGGAVLTEPADVDRRVVQIVGDDAIGDAPAALKKAAVAIAKAAGTDLLRVAFDTKPKHAVFLDADPWIDISDKAIAEAIRKRLV